MADARFDLNFDGTVAPGADPATVRRQLKSAFKLDEEGLARLFSGKPVFVKRNVDTSVATQFERIFSRAGAILRVVPIQESGATAPAPGSDGDGPTPTAPPGLGLAPLDSFIETPPEVKIVEPDTSHLSLVPGPDWSLEDCEPAADASEMPDTSHLTLAERDTRPDSKESGD